MDRQARAFVVVAVLGAFGIACGTTPPSDAGPGPAPVADTCVTDADCVIAGAVDTCCGSCPSAYSKKHVAADPCLVGDGTPPAPASCRPSSCSGVACPAAACELPLRAVCTDGTCKTAQDCGPGRVPFPSIAGTDRRCVPACATDDDCVLALHAQPCCPVSICPDAYPKSLVDPAACVIPAGAPIPAACSTSPSCGGGACSVASCKPRRASCSAGGACVLVDLNADAGAVDAAGD
jgi:hypothetical protein